MSCETYLRLILPIGTIDPEDDAESNAATDQSGNRSEAGDSYRETMTELAHSISVVTKKVIKIFGVKKS